MLRVMALLRASWLTATSYRLGLVFSLGGLVATFIPLYFIASTLQPLVANSIQDEGRQYFGFLVLGMGTMFFVMTAVHSLAQAVGSGIGNGTLEAMLATPSRVPTLLGGMIAYPLAWTAVRFALLVMLALGVGMPFAWQRLPAAFGIITLIIVAYVSVGLIGAALVLAFRTAGPLLTGTLTISTLLGGVYYSTSVIPSWIQSLSAVVPLTYGLRALRRTLLSGASLEVVGRDIMVLALFATGLAVMASWAFAGALRYARRTGTLAQY